MQLNDICEWIDVLINISHVNIDPITTLYVGKCQLSLMCTQVRHTDQKYTSKKG